jgi:hypothetical protein
MPDNLNRIKDIGLAREKWLNEQGIDTYVTLAGADPNWLYEQLKNEGKPPVSLEKIQGWVEEAKTLAAAPSQPEPSITGLPAPSQNCSKITEDGWKEFASFYITYERKHQVEPAPVRTKISYFAEPIEADHDQQQTLYRTHADHMEANAIQQWDRIEGDDLCRWIMQHVDDIVKENHSAAKPDDVAAMTQPTKPDSIRIVSIQVSDPIGGVASASAGEFFNGTVHAQQPLSFDFKLEYPASSRKGTPEIDASDCRLSLYIYEMPGDTLVLKPQKTYRQLLKPKQTQGSETIVIPLLPASLYRIRAIATLTNQTPVLSVIDIPLLQIL